MTESDRHDKQATAACGALSEQEVRALLRKWSAQLSEVHGHERAELEEWLREYTGWTADAPRLAEAAEFENEWKVKRDFAES